MSESLPYLTDDVAPLGGRIKDAPDDFLVEEIPLYEPGGSGTHTYFCIEKRGMTTLHAVRNIARALGVPHRVIGYAGLKDAEAVTRQVLSVEHVPPERITALDRPNLRVLWTNLHTNKLRLGHLKGNRFVIRVRGAEAGRLADARATLERLARDGVPNYFGAQRFGLRGDTWALGRALLRRDWVEFISILLGRPGDNDRGDIRHARELFEQGRYDEAARAWPYPLRDERTACLAMARTGGSHQRAAYGVDKSLKRLYVSAFQSYLFNQVVAQRIRKLGTLMDGDLAYRHANGAVFRVESAAVEQPRADAFEISPSGPLFGYRMTDPQGRPHEIEEAVLSASGFAPEDFRAAGAHKVKGARRALRFQPRDADASEGSDERGDYYEFRFALEAGCYATMVLREVCKASLAGE